MAICPQPPEAARLIDSKNYEVTWHNWVGQVVIGAPHTLSFLSTDKLREAIRTQLDDDKCDDISLIADDGVSVTKEHGIKLTFSIEGTPELARYLLAGMAIQTAIKLGILPEDIVLKDGGLTASEEGSTPDPLFEQTCQKLIQFACDAQAHRRAHEPTATTTPLMPATVT